MVPIALLACISVPFLARGFDPFAPYRDGDPLEAAEMNARFDRLATAIDDLENNDGFVPAGIVAFFNLPACPTGWTEYTVSRGRVIVGLNSGGTLEGEIGTALTDLENRPTGRHSHGATAPVRTDSGTNTGNVSFVTSSLSPNNNKPISVVSSGAVDGTNAPYVQLLACFKL